MDLMEYTKWIVNQKENHNIPEMYERFGIMNPEGVKGQQEVKPYPLPEREHMFALLWDIHDQKKLSATILPSEVPFTYEKEFVPGVRTTLHSHEYLELFYIVQGEYRQKILGNEFTFHKGELCLIDKNCQHQEILEGTSATVIFMGITNVMFNQVMEREVTTERIVSFLKTAMLEQKTLQQYLAFHPHEEAIEPMEETLLCLLQELQKHDVATPVICQGLLLRIFEILSRRYDFSLSRQQRKKMNLLLFEDITDYMRRHLNNMSIGRLTEKFHFQEDYFNRLLKAQTGYTYTEYLQRLRLQKAEELLMDYDYSIDRIVKEVGYKNKGYFYKIFMERYQMTPAQFRKRNRE